MTSRPSFELSGQTFGGGKPFLFAGPCVVESKELALEIATRVRDITAERGVPYVFKASFDKANRSSLHARRGPGMSEGLEVLAAVKEELRVPILTDVHEAAQCAAAAEVADVLQVPAFLCRQTDLLVAASETGRVVNVKKGQFLAPWDMGNVAEKCRGAGAKDVVLTERGTSFGYGRLVVDMNSFGHLAETGCPVVFDATHSVQEPGGRGTSSGGDRTLVPALARAAIATGNVDGLFFEVHPDPDSSPSDGPNMVRLEEFEGILDGILAVHRALGE